MTIGICPHCEQPVGRITFETIQADGPVRKNIRALSMLCPSCNAILGITLHPKALAAMAVPQIGRVAEPEDDLVSAEPPGDLDPYAPEE
jgi:hypothetical protein